MKVWPRLMLAWILVILLVATPFSSSMGQANQQEYLPLNQDDPARQKAVDFMARLTPEERVGQLFVVTFPGSNIDIESQIYDLIVNHHVGGVILLRSNDNFNHVDGTINGVYQLISGLQEIEWEGSQRDAANPVSGVSFRPQYIPLFIGVSQEGDAYPNDQLITGLSQLPSLMSIGATWDTSLAQQVGEVMGRELVALGFNLYLGPSLDVIDMPQMMGGEDLGTRAFGGDPYWVGAMGQAYITGLHEGSGNTLSVIAKHFPGRGGSDRSPEDEIATVRKSLEQLKQIELAPFFAVTGNASSPSAVADGLLVSHIRYQGFQDNIRATTRPVSSDKGALDLILDLPALSTWRSAGGIMVSDDLGSNAVRRFYEMNGNMFDAIQVAREAFYAGNDILYVNRFVSTTDADSYTTITRTLQFFAQKYRTDPEFARLVDASVERILAEKFRIYPEWELDRVIPDEEGLEEIGQAGQISYDVARRSVTLISPDPAELANVLPQTPQARDRIVFLTDVQYGTQCNNCPAQTALAYDALQNAVLRLYGTRATGQVSSGMMSSYSFTDIWNMMNGITEIPQLEEDLNLADWIVVSLLKPNPNLPESNAFRDMLSTRPEFLRNKKVVVFAFNSPYYLDSTEIAKLTAYYGLYSKTSAFVDVAARVLFQELAPSGSLPVSVPGIGYDLIQATSPDPSQVIPLFIDTESASITPTPAETPAPTPALTFRVDDVISLRTGVIYDHNHKPVPDNTPVNFNITIITESGTYNQSIDSFTKDGIAKAMGYRIDRAGLLEIRAVSGQGASSNILRLDITGGVGGITVIVAPTQAPTFTPEPSETPEPTITPTVEITEIPVATVQFKDWFFVLVMILGLTAGVSWIGIRQAVTRWGLRLALCGMIGGLLAYNYLAMRMPGSDDLVRDSGTVGVLIVTFIGIVIGWAIGLAWKQYIPGPVLSDKTPTGERGSTGERRITGPRSRSN